jgi:hypothetical protein
LITTSVSSKVNQSFYAYKENDQKHGKICRSKESVINIDGQWLVAVETLYRCFSMYTNRFESISDQYDCITLSFIKK